MRSRILLGLSSLIFISIIIGSSAYTIEPSIENSSIKLPELLVYGSDEIVFIEEDDFKYLSSLVAKNHKNETGVCLYGKIQGMNYTLTEISQEQLGSSNLVNTQCDLRDDFLGTFHTHVNAMHTLTGTDKMSLKQIEEVKIMGLGTTKGTTFHTKESILKIWKNKGIEIKVVN